MLPSELLTVKRYARKQGACLILAYRNGAIRLSIIEVNLRKRNTGVGSDIMRRLCKAADAMGDIITAYVMPLHESIKRDRLFRFYFKHGFKRLGNTHKIIREPRTIAKNTNSCTNRKHAKTQLR